MHIKHLLYFMLIAMVLLATNLYSEKKEENLHESCNMSAKQSDELCSDTEICNLDSCSLSVKKPMLQRDSVAREKEMKAIDTNHHDEHNHNKIIDKIEHLLYQLKSNHKVSVLILVLFFAFFLGMIHVLGPGHCKLFMAGQVLASEVNYVSVISSSYLFALLHSSSGFVLVGIVKLLSITLLKGQQYGVFVKKISFIVLILLGIYMLIKNILKKGHNHTHHHKHESKNMLITALSIGFMPCAGSILIAIYILNMQMYGTGILMIIFMALGMGTTLSVTNSLVLFTKTTAAKKLLHNRGLETFSRLVSIIGSIGIIVLGAILLIN